MIITKLNGGLGNQLFQYAAGLSLAAKNNTKLLLDIQVYNESSFRSYELNNFSITADIVKLSNLLFLNPGEYFRRLTSKVQRLPLINQINAKIRQKQNYLSNRYYYDLNISSETPLLKNRIASERFFNFDNSFFELPDNIYLTGYWQTEKYFKSISKLIRNEFTVIKNTFNKNANKIIELINSSNSVSIHVRGKDFLKEKGFYICDFTYYNKAVELVNLKVANPIFFIFTDDLDYCNQILSQMQKIKYVVVENLTNIDDFLLMSKCRHNIIANSTFSWWAAWLNSNEDKTVICPDKFIDLPNYDNRDIIPEEWISL